MGRTIAINQAQRRVLNKKKENAKKIRPPPNVREKGDVKEKRTEITRTEEVRGDLLELPGEKGGKI